MHLQKRALWRALAVVAALAAVAVGCSDDSDDDTTSDATTTVAEGDGATTTTAGETALEFEKPSGEVRGFDGTTIRVASIGIKSQLPGVEPGAQARIKVFNDTNEIPGVKLEYVDTSTKARPRDHAVRVASPRHVRRRVRHGR
jgi:hypothetical protein